MNGVIKYANFGRFLTEARLSAGIESQSALALMLECKQQTVNRWESGLSRPRPGEIQKLAGILKLKQSLLLEQAGYSIASTTPFAQPFPVDRLDPETFERFVEFLLHCLFRGKAEVRRAGDSGHTQDGIDISVQFPDGRRDSYQCKRVEQFGPADVARVVAAHKVEADKKYLVLSRVPSPQTQEAIRRTPNWELWGKEDLSRLVRTELSEDDQNRLVDIFFRGQRLSLLGRSEPGPWLTIDEFFAPFLGRSTLFSHELDLIGRKTEIAELNHLLETTGSPVILVTGPGGIGKSRLLKAAVEKFATTHSLVHVRFLTTSFEATRQSIEALGDFPKLLVIDDAHDRDGLGGLFEYAAVEENQTRLLLATRLYAEARIKREAARTAIENIPTVELTRPSLDEASGLAKAVLQQVGSSDHWASDLAKLTRDSPLITVMAARLIAKNQLSFESTKNEAAFRDLILGKFNDVIVGNLGSNSDKKLTKDILDVLALIQPFHPEDPALLALLQSLQQVEAIEAARVFRFLTEGGVIYQRGHQYRLMPDLLGDYLIEQSCIGPTGKLSPFAIKAFELVDSRQLENLLVNLGRMDWRLNNDRPQDTALLGEIWQTLGRAHGIDDQRLNAVRAVAMYQPRQALDFVTDRIRNGVISKGFSGILRSIAFDLDYLSEVCSILWHLGRDDRRELGPNPDHPIRVLTELCEFQERKPLEYSKQVLNFGKSLIERESEWGRSYCPLDFLRPICNPEGMTTESTRRELVMKPFLVDRDFVAPLREELITTVLALLIHPTITIAVKAAQFLHSCITYPIGVFGESIPPALRDKYDGEFEHTIRSAGNLIAEGLVHPIVVMTIAGSVAWHAKHGTGGAQRAAKELLAALPTTLEFRLLRGLAKGFGPMIDLDGLTHDWLQRQDSWLANLSSELKAKYPPAALFGEIESALTRLTDAGEKTHGASAIIAALLRDDTNFARLFVENSRTRSNSNTRPFLAHALCEISTENEDEGAAIVEELLDSPDVSLVRAAAGSLAGVRRPYREHDIRLIGVALGSRDEYVVAAASQCLWRFSDNPRQQIELCKKIHFEHSPAIADEIFPIFREAADGALAQLTAADVDHFLKRLINIPRLDSYWTQQFLSAVSLRFPRQIAEFLFARVAIAAQAESFEWHPANYGPYVQIPLRVKETSEAKEIFARTWTWLNDISKGRDFYFQQHANNVFDAMFGGELSDLVAFFDAQMETASSAELRLMSGLLGKAAHDFIFVYQAFVMRLLERCRAVDPDLAHEVRRELFNSAISGVHAGRIGEPTPHDVEQLKRSNEALSAISRLSPAFDLYQAVRALAESSIKRSLREVEQMDDR